MHTEQSKKISSCPRTMFKFKHDNEFIPCTRNHKIKTSPISFYMILKLARELPALEKYYAEKVTETC